MDFDWKGMVRAVAPGIATALGGPLAGNAVKYLEDAVLGPDQPRGDDKVLAAALQAATPEQLLALKKADQDFTLNMQKLGVDLEKIASDDRASARGREVATHDATPKLLALIYTGGYFALIFYVVRWGINANVKEVMISLVSIMTAAQGAIMNYYFGSSHDSSRKTDLLAQAEPVRLRS